MILTVLLFPLLLAFCYLLPLVGTMYAKENSQKWVVFWLVTLLSRWTLIPFFELFFECQAIMGIKILLSVALIMLLSKDKVHQVNTSVDSIVTVILEQKKSAMGRVGDVAKQYGLLE